MKLRSESGMALQLGEISPGQMREGWEQAYKAAIEVLEPLRTP